MTGEDGLLVEKILPGGAIEAWNKQCPGEIREIRAGDSAPTQLTASCIENVMLPVTRNIPHGFFPCDFSLEIGAKSIEPGIVMINGHEASSAAVQPSICLAVYSCCRKSSAANGLFTATSGRIPKLCGTSASQSSF